MRTTPSRSVKWWIAALVVILLLAFALRVSRLDRLPLWWDEGLSAHLAGRPPLDLLGEMQATNHADPPVYPFVLGGWRVLVGSSPFALRFFSALLGVVAVALTWAVGRWLTGKRSALLASLFVALAPMQVYYTREAKSYAFAIVCALLSTYSWGRKLGYAGDTGLPSGKKGWWVVYVLSTAAAVGSHYYLGLLVLWQGLWVVGSAVFTLGRTGLEEPARVVRWLVAAGVVALLLAPCALILFGTTVRGVTGVSGDVPLSLWRYASRVACEFSVGPHREGPGAWAAGAILVALAVAGARVGGRRAFLLTWVAVPLGAAYLVQVVYSFFSPRFLLYLGPVCYLLVGQGIVALWSRPRLPAAIAVGLAALLIGLWLPGLAHVYTAPIDQAEDPQPAIARIRAKAQPDDALAYVYIWQTGYLVSYYPQNELALYRAYYTPQTVGSKLASIFAAHPRLWLFSYRVAAENTAQNLSATWLEAEAYKVESDWYGNHHLALYLAPDFETDGVGLEEGVVSFGGRIELRYPLVRAQLGAGDVLALPLNWRSLAAPGEDYQVFVHLGVPGMPPLAQNDGPPRNGLSPTSTWAVGQEVLDRRALSLPDTIPPGRYLVEVGLYRLSDGSRLPVDGAEGMDALTLGYVEVKP